jgi:hypothetical protein
VYDLIGLILPGFLAGCEGWTLLRGWDAFLLAIGHMTGTGFTLWLLVSFGAGNVVQELGDFTIKSIKGKRYLRTGRDRFWAMVPSSVRCQRRRRRLRYGRPPSAHPEDADATLDQFMPDYEIAERRHIRVAAPADVTFAAACEIDLMRSPMIRALFRTRELILRSEHGAVEHATGVLAFTKALGWSVLAEAPDREIVMGTQPWNPNVVFRPLTPDEFLAFNEPEFVKIAWTLRADPIGAAASIFRHETRVTTTDGVARAKFRRYWSFFSPGIKLIRWLLIKPLRTDAERGAAQLRSRHEPADPDQRPST